MRKVKIEELFLMNGRTAKVLSYLREELSNGAARVNYNAVAKALHISRHCVTHNVGILLRCGYLTSTDGKLALSVELPPGFKFSRIG